MLLYVWDVRACEHRIKVRTHLPPPVLPRIELSPLMVMLAETLEATAATPPSSRAAVLPDMAASPSSERSKGACETLNTPPWFLVALQPRIELVPSRETLTTWSCRSWNTTELFPLLVLAVRRHQR